MGCRQTVREEAAQRGTIVTCLQICQVQLEVVFSLLSLRGYFGSHHLRLRSHIPFRVYSPKSMVTAPLLFQLEGKEPAYYEINFHK